MPGPRKGLCALLAVALLAAPVLSGCGQDEPTAAYALAHSGVLGGMLDSLKREDDEAELKELAERAPQSPEERQEAREQAEQAEVEVSPSPSPEPEGEG